MDLHRTREFSLNSNTTSGACDYSSADDLPVLAKSSELMDGLED